jgi:hypothetical protein
MPGNPTEPKKKRCRGGKHKKISREFALTLTAGKNLHYHLQRTKAKPEGMSRNSWKTGMKEGNKSREAQKRKRKKDVVKILVARKAAEGKWGAFV